MSKELGSGYSVAKDEERRREKLIALCNGIMTSPDLRPGDGKTYCNLAVRRVAKGLDIEPWRKDAMANEMIDTMESSPVFRKDTAERASAHAIKGGLAVAGHKYKEHGHVAVVYPTACQSSGSLGKFVAVVANVGKENGLMLSSQAFPVAYGEATYYLYTGV